MQQETSLQLGQIRIYWSFNWLQPSTEISMGVQHFVDWYKRYYDIEDWIRMMDELIRKAVFPVAGFAHVFYPRPKQPKELCQLFIEPDPIRGREAIAAGIDTYFCNWPKYAIEDHLMRITN